jgi:Domain of unknown function (DUF4260)
MTNPSQRAAAAAIGSASEVDMHPGMAGAVTGSVRRWLQLEGLAALAVAAILYQDTGRGWALFALLFLAPDLSFIAFAAGPRVGAIAYNAVHSYVAPLVLLLMALLLPAPMLLPFVYVWVAHIGFDRLMLYGLKYPSDFHDTHLGRKGRRRPPALGAPGREGLRT